MKLSQSGMSSAVSVASMMTVYTQPGAQRAPGNKASYKSLVPFAEKHGIYILFHNHYEYADPNIDVDSI
jgi:hypothetical protein